MPVTAFAQSVDIQIWATPMVSGGLDTFMIVYVNETRIDFSWAYLAGTDRAMIRAKYGSYPTSISDGYQVYYGNGVSASDTSVNFDENPGPIFYRAWGQKVDNTWATTVQEGSKESEILTLIGLIALCGLLSFIALRSSFWAFKVIAGLSWAGFGWYWFENPPSTITAGETVHLFVLGVIALLALGFALLPFWVSSGDEKVNGFQSGVNRLFGRDEPQSNRDRRVGRNSEYADRVNNALYGRRR